MDYPKISEVIKNRRIELGLPLEYVAQKIGVNRSTVLRWERGYIKGLNNAHIYLLSKILYLPIEALFGSSEGAIEPPEMVKKKIEVVDKVNSITSMEGLDDVLKFINTFVKK